MYEELMNEVHRQWLHEFDIEAARRRQLPRDLRPRESRFRFLRRRRENAAASAPCRPRHA